MGQAGSRANQLSRLARGAGPGTCGSAAGASLKPLTPFWRARSGAVVTIGSSLPLRGNWALLRTLQPVDHCPPELGLVLGLIFGLVAALVAGLTFGLGPGSANRALYGGRSVQGARPSDGGPAGPAPGRPPGPRPPASGRGPGRPLEERRGRLATTAANDAVRSRVSQRARMCRAV